jgi:alkylhydroperoxidase/carboxymuconolactone decarboxylase family protein YurZ
MTSRREQGTTLFTAILWLIGTVVIIQLWLAAAALDALLGGETSVLVPAAVASLALFLLNGSLLLFVLRFDRRLRRSTAAGRWAGRERSEIQDDGGAEEMTQRGGSVEPPDVVKRFAAEHPEVWEAYNRLGEATAAAGPLDERMQRLVKLAIAIGSQRQGAVNSHSRRALAAGCSPKEILQVGILAIPTIGWPAAFAAICWMNETIESGSAENR